MSNVLGIVNFEDNSINVEGLGNYRTIPAFTFLGRYRIVDFVISNFVNSGIDQIKILVKDKPRSLIEHIGSGSNYNINSKKGSLQILYPDQLAINQAHNHDIFLLNQYIQYLQEANKKYVVIAPSYIIGTINYNKAVKAHMESGAEITCIYHDSKHADEHFIGCDSITVTSSGRVSNMKKNYGEKKEQNIFLDSYVMETDLLIRIVKEAREKSALFNLKDMVKSMIDQHNIRGFCYSYDVYCVNSLKEYYDVNMTLLNNDSAKRLLRDNWPIYTTTNDNPPTYYGESATVKNSYISNGCYIEGDVENCIIGREVRIGKGAVVKNSLILPKAYVGENTDIDYVIADKYSQIVEKLEVKGSEDDVIYIGRREKI